MAGFGRAGRRPNKESTTETGTSQLAPPLVAEDYEALDQEVQHRGGPLRDHEGD